MFLCCSIHSIMAICAILLQCVYTKCVLQLVGQFGDVYQIIEFSSGITRKPKEKSFYTLYAVWDRGRIERERDLTKFVTKRWHENLLLLARLRYFVPNVYIWKAMQNSFGQNIYSNKQTVLSTSQHLLTSCFCII